MFIFINSIQSFAFAQIKDPIKAGPGFSYGGYSLNKNIPAVDIKSLDSTEPVSSIYLKDGLINIKYNASYPDSLLSESKLQLKVVDFSGAVGAEVVDSLFLDNKSITYHEGSLSILYNLPKFINSSRVIFELHTLNHEGEETSSLYLGDLYLKDKSKDKDIKILVGSSTLTQTPSTSSNRDACYLYLDNIKTSIDNLVLVPAFKKYDNVRLECVFSKIKDGVYYFNYNSGDRKSDILSLSVKDGYFSIKVPVSDESGKNFFTFFVSDKDGVRLTKQEKFEYYTRGISYYFYTIKLSFFNIGLFLLTHIYFVVVFLFLTICTLIAIFFKGRKYFKSAIYVLLILAFIFYVFINYKIAAAQSFTYLNWNNPFSEASESDTTVISGSSGTTFNLKDYQYDSIDSWCCGPYNQVSSVTYTGSILRIDVGGGYWWSGYRMGYGAYAYINGNLVGRFAAPVEHRVYYIDRSQFPLSVPSNFTLKFVHYNTDYGNQMPFDSGGWDNWGLQLHVIHNYSVNRRDDMPCPYGAGGTYDPSNGSGSCPASCSYNLGPAWTGTYTAGNGYGSCKTYCPSNGTWAGGIYGGMYTYNSGPSVCTYTRNCDFGGSLSWGYGEVPKSCVTCAATYTMDVCQGQGYGGDSGGGGAFLMPEVSYAQGEGGCIVNVNYTATTQASCPNTPPSVFVR